MTLRLMQYQSLQGVLQVLAADDDGVARTVNDVNTVYELAQKAIAANQTLLETVTALGFGARIDVVNAVNNGQILAPITHPDAAHCHVTGTGLTHLGSAESRQRMHEKSDTAHETDSMRMFKMGLEGGKPKAGETGVQPEWFYKGNGHYLRGPRDSLTLPDFAQDGGDEPEIAGIYVIAPDGNPVRLGYCLANEYSDHVTEKVNYLWLAHSKLRHMALGPELFVGDLPAHIEGRVRVLRHGETLWEAPFLTGEDNMSHALSNLEYHHFKYDLFRQAGDLHVHCFGTATASFGAGVRTEDNDIFEIEAKPFNYGLKNKMVRRTIGHYDMKKL